MPESDVVSQLLFLQAKPLQAERDLVITSEAVLHPKAILAMDAISAEEIKTHLDRLNPGSQSRHRKHRTDSHIVSKLLQQALGIQIDSDIHGSQCVQAELGKYEGDAFYMTVPAPDIVNPGRKEQGSV
jgi:DNA-nicking Smr family endonuclease